MPAKKTLKTKINNNENLTNIESNNNSDNNNSNNKNININNILFQSIKNKDLKLKKKSKNNIESYEKYEKSFDDIQTFFKKFTKRDLERIDTIIYHDENNDGLFSASIVYHYLKELDPAKELQIIPEKPGKFTFKNKIVGKNIIILDLSLEIFFLNEIKKVANSYIVIDDHSKTLINDPYIFNGANHAACAYTWKFFYPKKHIPNTILYIDSSDGKLFLSFIPHSYTTLFAKSTGIRFSHGKSKNSIERKTSGLFFDELWELINDDKKLNFYIGIGHYYEEFSENLKEQIAINAVLSNFQGYKVGLLNFNAPALTKPVARQIITNFRNKGIHIDFALCWGYEHINNSYRIQLIDDHKQKAINMSTIAKSLGTIGGNPKKGGGHFHVGNFYWPKNDKHDIWDLFTKQYL